MTFRTWKRPQVKVGGRSRGQPLLRAMVERSVGRDYRRLKELLESQA